MFFKRLGKAVKHALTSPNAPMFIYCLVAALGVGAPMAFLSTYLAREGMSSEQISYIMAVRPIAQIIGQYIWGIIADKSKTINKILAMLMIGVAASAVMFFFSNGFAMLLLATAVYYFFYSSLYPLMDTICLDMVARGQLRSYGDIRLMTSIGYIISVWFSGIVSEKMPSSIFIVMAVFTTIATITMIKIPRAAGQRKKGEKFNSLSFFAQPIVLIPLLSYLILQLVYASFDATFPIYFSIDLNGGDGLYGLSMAIRVAGEFCVLPFLSKIQRKVSFKLAFGAFMFMSAIRFFICCITRNVWLLTFTPIISGIGNIGAFTWLINYCGNLAPAHGKATVQSHLWMTFSIVQILGSLSIRFFVPTVDSPLYFLVCALAMVAAGLVMVFAKVDKEAARF